VIRKTGNLWLRQIYTTRAPPLFPHSFACNPDLSKSAVLRIRSHILDQKHRCQDVRTLLLAKKLVGYGEVSSCFDNCLHSLLCSIGHHQASTIVESEEWCSGKIRRLMCRHLCVLEQRP
jgi:hypothetical protein